MPAPRILFLGGTGIISTSCAAHAVASGFDVTVLNRGSTATRAAPEGARRLTADVRDLASMRSALGDREYDVVANFVAFTPDHVRRDLELFEGRTGQYVFISSASAYQKPPSRLPILESTPLRNPYWEYSRDKIACEDLLVGAYRDHGFPATIVRPSHTYDATLVPLLGGWTDIDRMRRGQPVVVHGDGTSLWTLTHSRDFALGFVGLLANPRALGETVHITGDEVLTWDQIYRVMADAAGAEPQLVHVASDTIAAVAPELSGGLLGDRSHNAVFDNAKVKALVPGYTAIVPFSFGAREIVDWYDEDASRRTVDDDVNATWDRLIALASSATRPSDVPANR